MSKYIDNLNSLTLKEFTTYVGICKIIEVMLATQSIDLKCIL